MSLLFLNPLGWLALAALGLPILIHLLRRRHTLRTPFAALQWIATQRSTRRQLNIRRWLLLLLRLLLLALLAALLATPVWLTTQSGDASHWVVVVPGVDASAARDAVRQRGGATTAPDNGVDDSAGETIQWRWLAPGFPPLETAPPSDAVATASLLRELDSELPASIQLSVVVPEQVSGLDGERPRFRRHSEAQVEWISVAGRMPSSAATNTALPIRILVRHAENQTASLRYLRAMESAWQAQSVTMQWQPTNASQPIPDDVDWLIWLGAEPTSQIEDWIRSGGSALLTQDTPSPTDALWRAQDGRVLASMTHQGAGRRLSLAGELLPRDLPLLLDADFPERLLGVMRGPGPLPDMGTASALHPHFLQNESTGTNEFTTRNDHDRRRPLDGWLALMIAALFLVERVVASQRSQEPA